MNECKIEDLEEANITLRQDWKDAEDVIENLECDLQELLEENSDLKDELLASQRLIIGFLMADNEFLTEMIDEDEDD
jgi:FtsZ-binding cell division protein ZapB